MTGVSSGRALFVKLGLFATAAVAGLSWIPASWWGRWSGVVTTSLMADGGLTLIWILWRTWQGKANQAEQDWREAG